LPFHELAVMPTDVDGAALGLALNAVVPTTLARLRLTHPAGGALVLGVLGASHVVTVERADTRFTEEVSCSARGGGTLPGHADAPGYQLDSRITRWGSTEFADLAARLRQRCATDAAWLGGRFPGADTAMTALAARPVEAGWSWRTWHLYPGADGGTAVHTISRWSP
jgi:hypothetical protein